MWYQIVTASPTGHISYVHMDYCIFGNCKIRLYSVLMHLFNVQVATGKQNAAEQVSMVLQAKLRQSGAVSQP